MSRSTESLRLEVAERGDRTFAGDTAPRDQARLRALVSDHVDFIWRSLRRLGVLEADLGDAAQQVFLVTARKLDLVRHGSERAFLFQTAVRVASDSRRTRRRRREVSSDVLRTRP